MVGINREHTGDIVNCGKPLTAISTSYFHSVGLRLDGTVEASGNTVYGACDADGWTDIVAVSAGYTHTVGLKADGTVVAAGNNMAGQCEVGDWTNIVSVFAGTECTFGIRSDGEIVMTHPKYLVG